MISFIVIGRNEGVKLFRCLKSIKAFVDHNKVPDYEIIYVDSQSTDDSVEKASQFEDVKIFRITGAYNAAIGRNIGYKESSGEDLFFIDGDMELLPDCFSSIFHNCYKLKYDFVSGDILEYQYDSDGKYLGEKYYYKTKLINDNFTSSVGGLFCIKRHLWKLVGGMRTKFRRSQDLDIGFRLASKGIRLLRKKETFIIHHTISYSEKKRLWSILSAGDFFYRAMIYRNNIFNKYIYQMLFRTDYTFLLLIVMCGVGIGRMSIIPILIYLFFAMLRAFFVAYRNESSFIREFVLISCKDFQMLFAIFFFWPREKEIMYVKVKANYDYLPDLT